MCNFDFTDPYEAAVEKSLGQGWFHAAYFMHKSFSKPLNSSFI